MILCLSSDAIPKYKRDIVRALGQPNGSRLQFRYSDKYIDQGTLDLISGEVTTEHSKQAEAQKCLVAFFDGQDTSLTPEIVPCRYATLESAEVVGTTVTLVMILGNLACSDDLRGFNQGVRSTIGGVLARREGGELVGKFCCLLKSEPPNVNESASLDRWEQIVAQLASKQAFEVGTCFYSFEGIYEVEAKIPLNMQNASYTLAPGKDYEVRLYLRYVSRSADTDRFLGAIQLQVAASNKRLQFTTNTVLDIDSRYDRKVIRFRTSKPTTEKLTVVSVSRKEFGEHQPIFDFDLLFKVQGRVLYNLGLAAIIGVALATPPLIELFKLTSPKLTAVLYIALYLGAGYVAAFHIEKPLSGE